MMTAERKMVSVRGWDNRRRVIIEDNRVLMEIARTSNNCHHCPICRRRVALVEKQLEGATVVWKWEYLEEGGMWLALPRTDRRNPIDVLRETTRLDIS